MGIDTNALLVVTGVVILSAIAEYVWRKNTHSPPFRGVSRLLKCRVRGDTDDTGLWPLLWRVLAIAIGAAAFWLIAKNGFEAHPDPNDHQRIVRYAPGLITQIGTSNLPPPNSYGGYVDRASFGTSTDSIIVYFYYRSSLSMSGNLKWTLPNGDIENSNLYLENGYNEVLLRRPPGGYPIGPYSALLSDGSSILAEIRFDVVE